MSYLPRDNHLLKINSNHKKIKNTASPNPHNNEVNTFNKNTSEKNFWAHFYY